ncbi:MAG: SO2930 family diheme c-type cytochrome [bacterium]
MRFFAPDQYPATLSAWGLISTRGNTLVPAADSHVYALNTALFTDYALKLRTLYIPPDQTAQFEPFEAFQLPVGSIISKTFFYQQDTNGNLILGAQWDGNPANLDMNRTRLLETRLLVKQSDGWDALPYIWQGDDAYLAITGDLQTLPTSEGQTLNYLVPSRNQCAGCHATDHTAGDIQPIGIKARHLNRPDPIHNINQLKAWQARGSLLGMPALNTVFANADMSAAHTDLNHRARSYLDINCGHCHNASGAADTSGLLLDYADHSLETMGRCKPPIAAGRGSGGHLYSIVPGAADQSILAYRMNITDPGSMMPELGRTLIHKEGHALIAQWIDAMQGVCL